MNSYLIGALTLCLAAQCAVAQYQQSNGGYNQRKMAPSPQTYGYQQQQQQQQQMSYGQQEQTSYEQPQQQYEQASYQPQQMTSYRAPSSAAGSSYDDRTPAASSYGGAAQKSSGYGKQQSSGNSYNSGYGQQAASSYAAPKAAKYEEPYYPPQPFAWGYDINDGYGGAQYHKETGDDYGKRTGSYGYTDAYGVYRQVDYVADEHGFRATIKTNEPGTANESPADVELHAYEPPSNYYAGNSGSSYGSSSYGSSSAAMAAPAKSSYGSGNSYGAQGGNSYSAPKQQMSNYGSAQKSSYTSKSASNYGQQARGGYGQQQQQEQYSSSVLVPVYQQAAPAKIAPVAAKRY